MPMLLLLINKLNTKKMVKMEHYHFRLIRLKNYVKQQIFLCHEIQNVTYCVGSSYETTLHTQKLAFSAYIADFIV